MGSSGRRPGRGGSSSGRGGGAGGPGGSSGPDLSTLASRTDRTWNVGVDIIPILLANSVWINDHPAATTCSYPIVSQMGAPGPFWQVLYRGGAGAGGGGRAPGCGT